MGHKYIIKISLSRIYLLYLYLFSLKFKGVNINRLLITLEFHNFSKEQYSTTFPVSYKCIKSLLKQL